MVTETAAKIEDEHEATIIEEIEEEIVEEKAEQDHITDHQYVTTTEPEVDDQDQDTKEMDVFDYIGFEIRNIEEREKGLLVKDEDVEEELLEDEMMIEEELDHEQEEFFYEGL